MQIISINTVFTIHGPLRPLLHPDPLLDLTSRRAAVCIASRDFPAIYKCIVVLNSTTLPLKPRHLALFFLFTKGLIAAKQKCCFVLYKSSPDLPSNGSSLRDLDCSHSNYQTWKSPVLLFIVTTSLCQDWVICAPAAFLGCGSRFSGSLSGIEP